MPAKHEYQHHPDDLGRKDGRHHRHGEDLRPRSDHAQPRRSGFQEERSRMDQAYANPPRYRDESSEPGLRGERDYNYAGASGRTEPGIASGPSGWAGAHGLDASEGQHQGFSRYGRGRHFGRGPKGYQRSDERICEDICERLTEADDIDARELSVSVNQGEVHLQGTVEARWMKHRVEDIADGCSGVRDIRNEIRVARGDHDSPRELGTQGVGGSEQHSPLVTERPSSS